MAMAPTQVPSTTAIICATVAFFRVVLQWLLPSSNQWKEGAVSNSPCAELLIAQLLIMLAVADQTHLTYFIGHTVPSKDPERPS